MLETELKKTLRKLRDKGVMTTTSRRKLLFFRTWYPKESDLKKEPEYIHLMEMINDKENWGKNGLAYENLKTEEKMIDKDYMIKSLEQDIKDLELKLIASLETVPELEAENEELKRINNYLENQHLEDSLRFTGLPLDKNHIDKNVRFLKEANVKISHLRDELQIMGYKTGRLWSLFHDLQKNPQHYITDGKINENFTNFLKL